MLATILISTLNLAFAPTAWPQEEGAEADFPAPACCDQPQWRTGPRLIKLGESMDFEFFLPSGMSAGDLHIFARYLEQGPPTEFSPRTADLRWLDDHPSEQLPLAFRNGRASASYTPHQPGNYLARWQAGPETLYRYFAVIEDSWVVLGLSTFVDLEAEPTLHATGIPLDYRLPIERFDPLDPLFRRFLGYHRVFGDAVVPHLPDTPRQTPEERLQQYGNAMRLARSLLPDPRDVRSARVEMHHDLDPGYTQTFMQLGVNDHCGLNEANAKPWLGMPEFPYFASPIDCRKTNQAPGGSVIAHQWDFCGGWHFLGPVSWHYKAASGDWARAERCLRGGVAELENLALLSGHPAFAVPLYDGLVASGYPNPAFTYNVGQPRNFRGLIDDVFVCSHALTAPDIARLMRAGAASVEQPQLIYSFDEQDAEAVRDRSGNGHDARLIGRPARVASPQGMAINLDGEHDSLVTDAPIPLRDDFTIGCWVCPGRFQRSYANLLSSHNDDQGLNHRGVSLEQDGDNTNRFYLIAGNGTQWLGTAATTRLQPDVWQHLAIVRRGDKLTHYLNGSVTAETSIPAGPLAPATDPWRVGDWARGRGTDASHMLQFVERYQRFMAFELPQQHQVAYARSLDIADYYRRHFRTTPRTVFVSTTDHPLYDMWWLCTWCADGILVPREQIPWDTKPSSVFRVRESVQPSKDPLSYEYILIEDQLRQMRFERQCPNPIWWFDYTRQESGPEGSRITYTRTPDVVVRPSPWVPDGNTLTTHLKISSATEFSDYALCLWGVPAPFSADRATVETNAKDFVPVRNTAGEFHLVLIFDLQREMELFVRVAAPVVAK